MAESLYGRCVESGKAIIIDNVAQVSTSDIPCKKHCNECTIYSAEPSVPCVRESLKMPHAQFPKSAGATENTEAKDGD